MSAGVYLKVIRERRKISRAELARQMKISVQTVANIENGDKEPGSSLLFMFIDRVQAGLEDVAALILGNDDEAEAYRRAEQYLWVNNQAKSVAIQNDPYVETRTILLHNELGPDEITSAAPVDVADQLEKLANLRERGILSDAEFQAQKAKLLA